MHDCYRCGCACYCAGDIEDHHVGDFPDCMGCECAEAYGDDNFDDDFRPVGDGGAR